MFSNRGFTLIETLIAMLIGITIVAAVGILGSNLIRQRANADANSAATSLSERKLEQLRALADPATDPDLAAGTHGPFAVDHTGKASVGGPYSQSWEVTASTPHTGSRKVTVRVTHTTNPFVGCVVDTYVLESS